MMHNQKMAACLKANGKVLREFGEIVYVPFGQEYNILLKNLNGTRALVNITIDGEDVVPGGLVIDAGREVELERFVKDLSKGNRFKFIERTAGIEKHRGIKVDDGLIRISYQYEKQVPVYRGITNVVNTPMWREPHTGSPCMDHWPTTFSTNHEVKTTGLLRSMTHDTHSYFAQGVGATTQSLSVASVAPAGITAPGSISTQKFQQVASFLTESETHVIVMKLLGETEQGKKIEQPITVKHQPVCKMCGHKNKARARFCSDCGAGLEIV